MSISDKEDRTYLYVTDYTSRPDLVPVHVDSQITRVLENNQILKIALFDEQAKLAAELNTGDYIAIKNLRLRPARAGMHGDLVGRLGGDERLISGFDGARACERDVHPELLRAQVDPSSRGGADGGKHDCPRGGGGTRASPSPHARARPAGGTDHAALTAQCVYVTPVRCVRDRDVP